MGKIVKLRRQRSLTAILRAVTFPFLLLISLLPPAAAQELNRGGEIVANLAGGRVIVHVAKEEIIFAGIDHAIEANH